jgi:hypothetical protein
MSRFTLFQKVYWGIDNKLVKITKVNYDTPDKIPVYDFTHPIDGINYRDSENNLFLTDKRFPDAIFRVGQEVYFHSKVKKVEPIWYKIIDIFIDESISNYILYKCQDEDGNIKDFTKNRLFDYSHTQLRRYDNR